MGDDRRGGAVPAGLYLEHGYLGPAARHRMAVFAEQPDARTLLGLARVAVAHGMAADAVTFATGALELEPSCRAAQELLAQLPAPAGLDM